MVKKEMMPDVRATLRQDVKQYFSVSDAGPHP